MPPVVGAAQTSTGRVSRAGVGKTPRCPGLRPQRSRAAAPGHPVVAVAAVNPGGAGAPPVVAARTLPVRSPLRGTQRAAALVGVRAAPGRHAAFAVVRGGLEAPRPPSAPVPV